MNKILLDKLKESLLSVLPVTVIILVLNYILPDPLPFYEILKFAIGATMLFFGMVLYNLGSETALSPIGETIGNRITGTKKIPVILLVGFIIGFIVTIAEPDLIVLGDQLGSIKWTLIITIAIGVGLFLVLALTRIIKKLSLNLVLIVLYGVLFALVIFTEQRYIPLAFDSGGVTTGPITVPFILALGIGIASVLGGKNKKEDSFGIVALCSIGPIISVILLSMIFKPEIDSSITTLSSDSVLGVLKLFATNMPTYLKDVLIALLPITLFYFIIDFLLIKTPKRRLKKIIIGLLYTYVGLSLFLAGVNVGFMSAGLNLGQRIASLSNNYVLIPIGMAIGCVLVLAEPAVQVLSKQVEEISNGNIKKKTIVITLCVSMAVAVGLSMLRVIFQFSVLYYLIPGYLVALGLTFFSPKVYTAIAFDSGGVVSGPMTTAFMLPLAIGASTAISGAGGVLLNAYGVVALVALTPLITIQIFGIITKQKSKKKTIVLPKNIVTLFEGDIIELDVKR